jgi:hypothetical protein
MREATEFCLFYKLEFKRLKKICIYCFSVQSREFVQASNQEEDVVAGLRTPQ